MKVDFKKQNVRTFENFMSPRDSLRLIFCVLWRNYAYRAQDARLKKNHWVWRYAYCFFQNPEIIFYHIFCIFNLDFFRALILQKCIGSMYLYAQLLLHFQADPFETLHTLLGWSEDMYIFFFQNPEIIFYLFLLLFYLGPFVGLGGSVGCAVRLETRRSRVQPPPRLATFFRGDWSWNIFYGHSLPSADSRRAVVSFWRKNVHNTG